MQPEECPQLVDQAAFLTRLARRLVGDPHGSADLVQATMLAAIERSPAGGGARRGWLATVARNLAYNTRRKDGRRAARERDVAREECVPDGTRVLELLEARRALLDYVVALPGEQRMVVYLRYYEGLTPTLIAERLGIPLKTVKSRHTRAIEKLRRRLDARSGDDPLQWMSALGLPLSTGALRGLAMKKLAVVLLALSGAFFAWREWRPGSGGTTRPDETPSSSQVGLLAEEPGQPDLVLPQSDGSRTAVARSEEAAAGDRGALLVRLLWAEGGEAGNVGIELRCERDPALREEHFFASTDPHGEALLEGLFAGPATLVIDRGAEYAVDVVADRTTTVELAIPVGCAVTGIVVDAGGEGVAGAEVWCESGPGAATGGALVARAGADGRFSVRDLPPMANIGARASGHLPSILVETPMASGEARQLRLVLGPAGGGVSGRVVDPSGDPVAGARVRGGPPGGAWVEADGESGIGARPVPVRTGADGTFELPGDLPTGPQPVFAVARGYPIAAVVVDVGESAMAFVELRLAAPAAIAGRVVVGEAQPVAGARVSVVRRDYEGLPFPPFPSPEATTDAGGEFTLALVAPGTRELYASVTGNARLGQARGTVECTPGETARCELVLDLGLSLTGRVVDHEGAVLPGWQVFSRSRDARRFAMLRDTTDEQGEFLITNLAQGRHDVTVSAPGESPMLVRASVDAVEAGADGLTLVVENTGSGRGTLHGVLRAAAGELPGGVRMIARLEGGQVFQPVELDAASGQFEAEVRAGTWRLRVFDGTRTIASSEAFPVGEGRDVDAGVITIDAPGHVELTILGPLELGLADTPFHLERSFGEKDRLERVEGTWRSGALPPGEWRLVHERSDLFIAPVAVAVRSGETSRKEVAATAGHPVRVELKGELPLEIELEARDPSGMLLAAQHVSARDAAHVELVLPQGPAVIVATTGSGVEGRVDVVVGQGASTGPPLVLELHP